MKYFFMILSLAVGLNFAQNAHALKNLKKTVAVFEFQNDSGYAAKATLSKDFSDQLSDALVQIGKFNVLTRADLDVVFAEQDLAKSDRMAKSTSAQTGKAIPAQILVKGKIAEFEEDTSGGGQGLRIKGVSLGTKKSTASVAVLVQLIDSTTGEIISSKRVEGEARAGGLSIGYSGDFDISSSNFKKTPMGKAVQMAIDRAVVFIGEEADKLPWEGKVITFKNNEVFINAGENVGVSNGDIFTVYRKGESLIDPDTGMDLGSDTKRIVEIKVFEVKDKFSKANVLGGPDLDIKTGDVVSQK